MKKLLVNEKLTEEQIKQFESFSDSFEVTFDLNEKDAEILVGKFSPAQCKEYPNLELLLTTAVGYDNYIKKGVLPENTILCNAVDAHTEEVAEHVFATMVSMTKNLHLYRDVQKKHLWYDEGVTKSICDLTVVILGLGNIGKYLAQMCKRQGMYVIGVKRNLNDKPDYVDELYNLDKLDEILPRVDAVLSVLPSTKETFHIFTKERFELMKKDAILVNAGRGDLIDTKVLIDVLENKIIKGVGQDVFEKEPIPEDSKLWDLDNLLITPHVAGFFHLDKNRQKWVDICCANLRRYANNEPLENVVLERE